MNERDIQIKRILMELYQTLDSIELSFDKLEEISSRTSHTNFSFFCLKSNLEKITGIKLSKSQVSRILAK